MNTPCRLSLVLILSVAAASLALAGKDGGGSSKHAVTIKDMKYDPATLEIHTGDTVVWTNDDDRDHSVVASDGTFDSDNIRPGKSFSFQFTKPGKIQYGCSYHPRMKGTIKVSAVASSDSSGAR